MTVGPISMPDRLWGHLIRVPPVSSSFPVDWETTIKVRKDGKKIGQKTVTLVAA